MPFASRFWNVAGGAPTGMSCLSVSAGAPRSLAGLFEKYPPGSIAKVEAILGEPIGQGTRYHDIPDEHIGCPPS